MGNEKCIPFSALAFPASFILKYHTLLLLLPLPLHLSFPLEMSVAFFCVNSDLGVTSSLCLRFLQQLYAWIQDEQSLTGGLPYRHTGGEPQRRVTVKALPGGTLSDRPAGSACLHVSHMHMRGNGAGRGNVSLTYGFECCFYCYSKRHWAVVLTVGARGRKREF